MDKYKINYIFNEKKDMNDILIDVLDKELKKYLQMIYKNNVPSSHTYLSLDGGKNC